MHCNAEKPNWKEYEIKHVKCKYSVYQGLRQTEPEAVFFVMLGTSSFPARHELLSCFPSTQHD